MLKFAIPAVAALGLVAFAAQSQANNPVVQTGVSDMGWHLSHEGEFAKLAYGLANSDQLALMMTCAPGQTEAVLYGDVLPVAPHLQKTSAGPSPIDPLTGGLEDDVRLPIDHPSIARLADRGRMAVQGEDGRFELTASREERELIGDFFAHCENRRA